eukprot:CAMPEP_0169222970 /NCGR_PEP_ID=MMETSP1016-20121227/21875_1 /TAXON_ID=342587 /ORGANISM="Karlodinium micrum, Strain CCMP2283" /LENGTH=83 /DNA_ID=CAMNT_0009301299 /DNA_START=1630 /DNA_END=1878 /DNA_ORIENTATION=-
MARRRTQSAHLLQNALGVGRRLAHLRRNVLAIMVCNWSGRLLRPEDGSTRNDSTANAHTSTANTKGWSSYGNSWRTASRSSGW